MVSPSDERVAMQDENILCFLQVCWDLQHTLLLQEDQDDRLVPDFILLWLHSHVLLRPWDHVWSSGIFRILCLCAPHIQEHKMRLAGMMPLSLSHSLLK